MGVSASLIGLAVDGHTISEVLFSFPVLWQGWELDSTAWVVKLDNGTKAIVETNHGRRFIADTDRLEKQIASYQHAIDLTKKAIQILNGE